MNPGHMNSGNMNSEHMISENSKYENEFGFGVENNMNSGPVHLHEKFNKNNISINAEQSLFDQMKIVRARALAAQEQAKNQANKKAQALEKKAQEQAQERAQERALELALAQAQKKEQEREQERALEKKAQAQENAKKGPRHPSKYQHISSTGRRGEIYDIYNTPNTLTILDKNEKPISQSEGNKSEIYSRTLIASGKDQKIINDYDKLIESHKVRGNPFIVDARHIIKKYIELKNPNLKILSEEEKLQTYNYLNNDFHIKSISKYHFEKHMFEILFIKYLYMQPGYTKDTALLDVVTQFKKVIHLGAIVDEYFNYSKKKNIQEEGTSNLSTDSYDVKSQIRDKKSELTENEKSIAIKTGYELSLKDLETHIEKLKNDIKNKEKDNIIMYNSFFNIKSEKETDYYNAYVDYNNAEIEYLKQQKTLKEYEKIFEVKKKKKAIIYEYISDDNIEKFTIYNTEYEMSAEYQNKENSFNKELKLLEISNLSKTEIQNLIQKYNELYEIYNDNNKIILDEIELLTVSAIYNYKVNDNIVVELNNNPILKNKFRVLMRHTAKNKHNYETNQNLLDAIILKSGGIIGNLEMLEKQIKIYEEKFIKTDKTQIKPGTTFEFVYNETNNDYDIILSNKGKLVQYEPLLLSRKIIDDMKTKLDSYKQKIIDQDKLRYAIREVNKKKVNINPEKLVLSELYNNLQVDELEPSSELEPLFNNENENENENENYNMLSTNIPFNFSSTVKARPYVIKALPNQDKHI